MARNLQRQRGLSVLGLLIILGLVGFVALVAMKVFPTYIEYKSIESAIVKAKTAGSTIADVRKSFNASAMVQDISSIGSGDLEIYKEDNDFVVSFAYEKKVPLFGPVSLVIDYAGDTRGK